MKITVDEISGTTGTRLSKNVEVSRVPCIGECLCFDVDGPVYWVHTVIHVADAGEGAAVAYVRIKDA